MAPAQPMTSELLQHSDLTTEQWYKSKNTQKVYVNYVKSGKAWLVQWVNEGQKEVDSRPSSTEGEQSGECSIPEEHSMFAGAFDKISEHTPMVLCLLMAYKCDHEKHGYATTEGLHSTFKEYFELIHNCQGDYWWYNAHTNK
ncbi:hypothetical protein BKA93DRAFT_753048 [Sparassis latifolia]